MQSIWTHHCTLDIYTLQDLGSVGKSLGWVRFVQLGTHFCCRGKGAGMEKWEIYYIHWEMGNKKRFLLLLAYWPHIFYTEHTKKGGRLCNLKSAESALTQQSVSLHAVGFTQWWQVSLALTGHGWLAQRVGYRATLKAGALLAGGCVASWRVRPLNEQSVDLALILIGSKLSFGSPDGWQEANPGTPPRRKSERRQHFHRTHLHRVKLIIFSICCLFLCPTPCIFCF